MMGTAGIRIRREWVSGTISVGTDIPIAAVGASALLRSPTPTVLLTGNVPGRRWRWHDLDGQGSRSQRGHMPNDQT